jgi:Tfp pilus assembly protein PilO
VVLMAGYAGIYMPFSSAIEDTSKQLVARRKRLDLADEVERLRAQYKSFKARLPEKKDTNEWVQYVLGGVRQFPVRLKTLDADPTREFGPYKAVVLRIELEGQFPELNSFLVWLETNKRLFRIDAVRIQPHLSGNGMLVMNLTVLGAMG